jgi:hypothetical protein
MRALLIAALLGMPGAVFLAYTSVIGDGVPEWTYFWYNYVWCAAVLYAAAFVLRATRAKFRTWVIALIGGNLGLIGFCLWMANFFSKGYRDAEILWALLFPVQVLTIGIACRADTVLRGAWPSETDDAA